MHNFSFSLDFGPQIFNLPNGLFKYQDKIKVGDKLFTN